MSHYSIYMFSFWTYPFILGDFNEIASTNLVSLHEFQRNKTSCRRCIDLLCCFDFKCHDDMLRKPLFFCTNFFSSFANIVTSWNSNISLGCGTVLLLKALLLLIWVTDSVKNDDLCLMMSSSYSSSFFTRRQCIILRCDILKPSWILFPKQLFKPPPPHSSTRHVDLYCWYVYIYSNQKIFIIDLDDELNYTW